MDIETFYEIHVNGRTLGLGSTWAPDVNVLGAYGYVKGNRYGWTLIQSGR